MESVRALDEELCSCLDRGDHRSAGTWLVRRHAHQVLALCRAMVRDLETAEDLTQEVFERAFAGLEGFRREASSRTWLLTIARNLCIDHLRAQQREPSTGGRLDGSEPDEHADDSPLPSELVARRRGLKTALNELNEVDRALVVLRYRHGLEYPELAQVFGLREGAIRMRLSRALARMRAALEQAPVEPPEERAAPSGPARPAPAPQAGRARLAEPPPEAAELEVDEEHEPTPVPVLRRPAAPGAPTGAARPVPARRPFISSEEITPLPEFSAPRAPAADFSATERAAPTPPPAPPHAMGQALERLDPGLPLGLLERLLDSVAAL